MRNRNATRPTGLYNLTNMLTRTEAMRVANQAPAETETRLTPKQTKVVEAFRAGDFGCQTESVRVLVGAVMGFEIPKANATDNDGFHFIPGAVVIDGDSGARLIGYTDSDGDACGMIDDQGTAVEGYAETSDPAVRAATEEEVRAFHASFTGI